MNNYTLEDVVFTTHILERYTERIMDKTGADLKVYIAQNEDKIKEKLLMLYNSAELLWSGKIKVHNFTHFYVNRDGWVIVVDKEGKKLITVYKVDLELGTDFNKEYVSKMKETVLNFNKQLENKELENLEKKERVQDEIKQLEQDNINLKNQIDLNNSQIDLLKQELIVNQKEYDVLEAELHKKIERFVGARIF